MNMCDIAGAMTGALSGGSFTGNLIFRELDIEPFIPEAADNNEVGLDERLICFFFYRVFAM